MASKIVTREQAQQKKEQAAAFEERMGDSGKAAEFEGMTVDEYAEHKGLTLTNPNRRRRNCYMPNNAPTKVDLQDTLDQIQDILESAYTPESTAKTSPLPSAMRWMRSLAPRKKTRTAKALRKTTIEARPAQRPGS